MRKSNGQLLGARQDGIQYGISARRATGLGSRFVGALMMDTIFWVSMGMLATAVMACGGAQSPITSEDEPCSVRLDNILAKGEVCYPIGLEQLESKVKNLRRECSAFLNPFEDEKAVNLLTISRSCSEEVRQHNASRDACVTRVRELKGHLECVGKMCERALKEVTDIISSCKGYSFDDDTLVRADSLVASLNQRIHEEKIQTVFDELSKECRAISEIISRGDLDEKELFSRLLIKLEQSGDIEIAKTGKPKVDASRKEVLRHCGETLNTAGIGMVDATIKVLGDKRVQRKPEAWMAHYDALEQVHGKLTELQKIFPNHKLIGKTNDTLKEFTRIKQTHEAVVKKNTAAKLLRLEKKALKQCDKMAKKINHLESKVRSHTKNGNQKKVAAYGAKLAKEREKMGNFIEEIHLEFKKNAVHTEKQDQILELLEEKDCLDNTISKT